METVRVRQGMPKVFSPTVIIHDGKGCFPRVLAATQRIFCEPFTDMLPIEKEANYEVLDLSKHRRHKTDVKDGITTNARGGDKDIVRDDCAQINLDCTARKLSDEFVPFKKRAHGSSCVAGDHRNREMSVNTSAECLSRSRQYLSSYPGGVLAHNSSSPEPRDRPALGSCTVGFHTQVISRSTPSEPPSKYFCVQGVSFTVDELKLSSAPFSRTTSPERTYHVLKPPAHTAVEDGSEKPSLPQYQLCPRIPEYTSEGDDKMRWGSSALRANSTEDTRTRQQFSPVKLGSKLTPGSAVFSSGRAELDRWWTILEARTPGGLRYPDAGYCSEPAGVYNAFHNNAQAQDEESDLSSSHSCPSPSNGHVTYRGKMTVVDAKSLAEVQYGGDSTSLLSDGSGFHTWPGPANQKTPDRSNMDGFSQDSRGEHYNNRQKSHDVTRSSMMDMLEKGVRSGFLDVCRKQKDCGSVKSQQNVCAAVLHQQLSVEPAGYSFSCVDSPAKHPGSKTLTREDYETKGDHSLGHGDPPCVDSHDVCLEKREARKEPVKQTAAADNDTKDPGRESRRPLAKRKRPRQKTYPCPLCHVTCSNRGQLLGHLRTHTGERPYPCSEPGCCKTFVRNEELTRHRRIHSGERPYVCGTCCKAFTRKDHLNKHLRVHALGLPE